jgi:hypothetical protein
MVLIQDVGHLIPKLAGGVLSCIMLAYPETRSCSTEEIIDIQVHPYRSTVLCPPKSCNYIFVLPTILPPPSLTSLYRLIRL